MNIDNYSHELLNVILKNLNKAIEENERFYEARKEKKKQLTQQLLDCEAHLYACDEYFNFLEGQKIRICEALGVPL